MNVDKVERECSLWALYKTMISFDCGEWKRSALDLLQENFMMAEVLALYSSNLLYAEDAEKEFRKAIAILNKENAKFNDKYSFEFVEITGKDFKKFRDEHDVNVICAFRKIGWKY